MESRQMWPKLTATQRPKAFSALFHFLLPSAPCILKQKLSPSEVPYSFGKFTFTYEYFIASHVLPQSSLIACTMFSIFTSWDVTSFLDVIHKLCLTAESKQLINGRQSPTGTTSILDMSSKSNIFLTKLLAQLDNKCHCHISMHPCKILLLVNLGNLAQIKKSSSQFTPKNRTDCCVPEQVFWNLVWR